MCSRSDPPAVSIVLAVRDEEARIGGCLESILAQTLDDWELIVVDDGSRDATCERVAAVDDPRIRLLTRPPRGHTPALRDGVAAARGPLIARQDADDRSLPERLERQLGFLRAYPQVAVLGTAWREVDAGGGQVRSRARVVTGAVNHVLPRFNPIAHSTVMARRSALERLGGYDPRYRWAQDYDLWLRADRAGLTLWNLEEVLAVRAMTGENIGARKERAQIREEMVIRWRDARERAGRDAALRLVRLAGRVPSVVAPLALKRLKRRARGQAP